MSVLVAVALCISGAVQAETPAEGLKVKAFKVEHRSLMEAAELAEAVLSEEGSLRIRPNIKTLVVEDYENVLGKVQSLIHDFDVPPRNVKLTLNLIVGTDERAEQDGRTTLLGPDVAQEIVDAVERIRRLTKWSKYEIEGSRSVQGVEGGETIAQLSDDYRVVMQIDAVDEERQKLMIKRFALQKIRYSEQSERYEDIFVSSVITPLDRLNQLVVASGPDASKALFLTLQAELR
ncbi:hypothetical protein ABI59_02045 [Acidobacteria bacterium Mor1]|nr:hypothetical protein ABI59_02045 [Acidobacteria bacterium Mor1]